MVPRPTVYIPVHGTWDIGLEGWWRPGSKFDSFATKNNLFQKQEIDPFHWCGSLDGVDLITVLSLGVKTGQHEVWSACGDNLKTHLKQYTLLERNLIVHSHGLQVLAYCNIPVNNIISVGSPIRKDMFELYLELKKRSRSWLHIYDERWDKMGFLGQGGDGKWFGSRSCPYALNEPMGKISHSSILRDEPKMKYWVDKGWFSFLRA